ncbi:MAG: tRNA (N6-isopentenyl adenosine(37)-C2)-methylthiotransferase MiaB [Alphaproteobacteria bacterium]
MEKKKLHIKTWGCQMNVYDSQKMADVLAPMGYIASDVAAEADMVIYNTCHIREKAAEKLYSDIGRLKKSLRKAGNHRKPMVAVAGCVAQAEGKEIISRTNQLVDMVIGPQSYHLLPEIVADFEKKSGIERRVYTDFQPEAKFDYLPEEGENPGAAAFLSIQEGCDKFCSFCVVPYTRGAEFSRPASDIMREARRLVGKGVKELTLLGQNVNAWRAEGLNGQEWGFARLLQEVANIDGLLRLRYTTSHPKDMDDELIAAHGDIPQLMPFLHLPIQSGADSVLAAMNRKHTADDYRRTIEKLRAVRPDISLSSDFIVGFPGETDQDFADTVRLIEDVVFAQAYSFKYSRRPGTPGAVLPNQLSEDIKSARLQILQEVINRQQMGFNQHWVGKKLEILAEKMEQNGAMTRLSGRSPYMQSTHFIASPELFGKVLSVKIIKANPNSLTGEYEQ